MTKPPSLRRPGYAILALAAFALLTLTAWRGYALVTARAQTLERAQTGTATAAVYVGNYIARTVDAADLLADEAEQYVREQGGIDRVSKAGLQQRLAALVQATSIDDNMVVVDRNGMAIASSQPRTGANLSLADRAWFRAHAFGGRDVYLGPAVRSRVTGNIVYTHSQALRGRDGRFEGAISVGLAPTQPKPVAARRPGEPLAQVWTTDDRRFILASHIDFDTRGNPRPQVAPFTTPPSGPAGFLPAGEDRITAFASATGRPLVATVSLPRSEALAAWRRSLYESLLLLAVSALVIGGLAISAARFADQDHRARIQLERTAGELSAALGDKDLLLKEIHHRVKNNLQITSSLIQLQARSFQDPQVRAAFAQTQQRLRSIGLLHDVLYNENAAARADIGVYLTELAREVATAHGAEARGVTVTVDAEPIRLSPAQVTPLGLSLSEVLTNAFKHAFPEGRSGSIRVQAREHDGEVEVVVRDDGAGFVGTPRREGSLGLTLISVLARQLRGAYSFSSDNGAVFRLTFPAQA
jgi:two-component sensor histidine kinase